MNLHEVQSLKECPNRYVMSVVSEPGVSVRQLFKAAVKNKKLDVNPRKIKAAVEMTMGGGEFINQAHRETQVEYWAKRLQRLCAYISSMNLSYKEAERDDITIGGEIFSVSPDIILQDGDKVFVCKVKYGAKKVSLRAHSGENRPDRNLELFGMYLYGKKKFPGKHIVSTFFFVKVDKAHEELEEEIGRLLDQYVVSVDFELFFARNSFNGGKDEILAFEEMAREIRQSEKIDAKGTCKGCFGCPYESICNRRRNEYVEPTGAKEVVEKGKDARLTPMQEKIVKFRDGVLRVNAAAGSGKTNSMAMRIAEMLEEGVDPKDFLVITYTRKGAEEIRERISVFTDKGSDIKATTFNAWGQEILDKEYAYIFSKKPNLIDKIDRYKIISKIIDENPKIKGFDYKNPLMSFKYAKGAIVRLDQAFQRLKSYNCDIKSLDYGDDTRQKIYDLFQKYEAALIENNALEYADQVNYLLALLEISDVLSKYNAKHIIVDEFQDTDVTQLEILKKLHFTGNVKSLVVVGDDSQAIYGFKNADNKNILNFHNTFSGVVDVTLKDNFRSTKSIVALANKVNELNEKRVEKEMVSQGPAGKTPEIQEFKTWEKELAYIVDEAKRTVNNKQKMTIIARTKGELIEIQEHLNDNNIKSVIIVPERVIDDAGANAMIGAAKFLKYKDLGSLLKYLGYNEDFSGLDRVKLELHLKGRATSLLAEIEAIGETDEKEKMLYFERMCENIQSKGAMQLKKIIEDKRFKTLNEISEYLEDFLKFEDNATYENPENGEPIVLVTAHSAKGKEWKKVLITINKYEYEYTNDEVNEEERRLIFVSITRAREELIITYNLKCKNIYPWQLKDLEIEIPDRFFKK